MSSGITNLEQTGHLMPVNEMSTNGNAKIEKLKTKTHSIHNVLDEMVFKDENDKISRQGKILKSQEVFSTTQP